MFDYIFVSSDEEYQEAQRLFNEYAQWLNIDLSFQKFEQELLSMRTMYAQPKGCILLCKQANTFIACIAVRFQSTDIAEFKRMYVQQAFQQKGIGSELLTRALEFSKTAGYKKVRLDTLDTMLPAMNLYEKNGFYTIPAYYFNPEPTAVYFEKEL
jgi:ribosomal protein S18 acetylase RimI-like enzyme